MYLVTNFSIFSMISGFSVIILWAAEMYDVWIDVNSFPSSLSRKLLIFFNSSIV